MIKKNNKLIMSIIFFILFIMVGILYNFKNAMILDSYVYNAIIFLKNDSITNIMKFCTFFGSVKFIGIILILLLFSIYKYRKLTIIIYAVIGDGILNTIVKLLFKRDRPEILQMITEDSYSFPSGHTMVSVVFYGLLIYFLLKLNINKVIKKIVCIILAIIPILVMISRIYLGVHYFTDILGGLFLSISYLLILIEIIERKKII